MWLLILSVNHDTLVLYSFKRLHVYDFPSINLTSLVLNPFLILNHQEYSAILPKFSKRTWKTLPRMEVLSKLNWSKSWSKKVMRNWSKCWSKPRNQTIWRCFPNSNFEGRTCCTQDGATNKIGGPWHHTPPPPQKKKKNYCNPL